MRNDGFFLGGNNSGSGGEADSVDWTNIQNKPTVYPPDSHNHDDSYYLKSEIDNEMATLQTTLESEQYKVKSNSTDMANYLDQKVDGTTITVVNNKLATVSVQGLTVGVASLNEWLSGTERNVQNQINSLNDLLNAVAAGMRFLGKFETKADLDAVTAMENGDVTVVLADESRGGGRSLYVYSGDLGMWDFIGEFTFSDEFIALSDTPNSYVGHDGKVVKVDEVNGKLVFNYINWSDIQNKPTSSIVDIDDSVDKRHTHSNKVSLDKITVVNDEEIHINGIPYNPASSQKQYLNAYRSGSSQFIRSDDTLVFNHAPRVRGIQYNNTTGHFTLESGRVYDITVSIKLDGFNTYVPFRIVRASDGQSFYPMSEILSSSKSYINGTSGVLSLILEIATTQEFCVKVGTFGSNEDGASLNAGKSSLKIVEI